MPIKRFDVSPGVVLDDSATAAEGRHRNADRVRWKRGIPECIGGWQKRFNTQLTGKCRAVHGWRDSSRRLNEAYGTSAKLYVRREGTLYDLTPAGLTAGNEDGGTGGGYGMGLYDTGYYGGAASGSDLLRTWSLDNWGEKLIALPRGEKLYRWSNDTGVLPVAIADAPTVSDSFMRTPEEFIALLGTQEQITGQFDPLLVRWCERDNIEAFTATATNDAGASRAKLGSRIVGGRPVLKRSILWTDEALHEMIYTGDSSVYEIEPIGEGGGLLAPNAHVDHNGRVFWLGRGGFMQWTGGLPQTIDSAVQRALLENLPAAQTDKIVLGFNKLHNEIWCFYPHASDGLENSRYVAWIVDTDIFETGTFDRMAWRDSGAFDNPVAASADGYVYDHEVGTSADGGAINAFFETANIDLEDGEFVMRIDEILPDWERLIGSVQVQVTTGYEPNSAGYAWPAFTIDQTVKRKPFRAEGKWARVKVSTVGSPSWFRGGAPRVNLSATTARR